MTNADQKKQAVARAAIEYVEYDDIVGVGTGSTVDFFIEYLKPIKNKISGAVASSIVTKEKLSKKFTSNNTALITRERHRIKLNQCLKEIDNFLKKDQNKDLELAAEDLRMATRHLGSIVGKVDVEEILGSIFKDFCIGK